MNHTDPILKKLTQIDRKLDQSLGNQAQLNEKIAQIDRDTKRTAAVVGGVSGGLIATGIALIKAKFGW